MHQKLGGREGGREMGTICAERNKDEEEEMAPLPGFRFHPTDEELVGFYLRRKVENKPITLQLIKQIDIYKYDPWELPKVSSAVGDSNKERYFFCIRERKYRNSIRPNRVTGSGFWKATGIDKPIYSSSSSSSSSSIKESTECIGLKKSLVYYRGTAGKGTKTDWMMHEFRLPLNTKNAATITQQAEVWTLCRIFKRIPSGKRYTPVDSKQTTKKPNPSGSNSKTCSSDQKQVSFGDSLSLVQPNQRTNLFLGQLNSINHQASFTATHSSFCNPNVDDILANGNWDELRTVVELALDPRSSDCK